MQLCSSRFSTMENDYFNELPNSVKFELELGIVLYGNSGFTDACASLIYDMWLEVGATESVSIMNKNYN